MNHDGDIFVSLQPSAGRPEACASTCAHGGVAEGRGLVGEVSRERRRRGRAPLGTSCRTATAVKTLVTEPMP
jgi:hypothetical protein